MVHRSLIIRDQYKSGETLIGYDPNFLNLYSSKSFIKNQVTTAKAAFVRYFYRIKWRRLYSAVGIVHQYLFKNLLLEKIFSFIEAVKIWKSLKTKEDLYLLEHDGIRIGDLICEAYVALKRRAPLEVSDKFLIFFI